MNPNRIPNREPFEMVDKLRLAIVTPVHNRKEITLQCLRSIMRLEASGLDISVVIVDDGSTDGTSDAIRAQFPSVDIVVGDGNLWFTEGTNVGIRRALESDPKYILLINDDQVFDGRCLLYMVETAAKYPRSIVGSLLLLWDTPHKLFQFSPVWSTMLGGWRHWHSQTVWTIPDKPWQVDIIVGNCLLVPVEAFRETGLMDSKRYPNFGDAEFTPRLKRRGWRLLIDPRARVFCQPNTPPPRVREMGLKKTFSALILDLGSSHNLRRRFYATVDGAPSKIQGLIAFAIFLARTAIGKSHETGKWGTERIEAPLNETFASRVVVDE